MICYFPNVPLKISTTEERDMLIQRVIDDCKDRQLTNSETRRLVQLKLKELNAE